MGGSIEILGTETEIGPHARTLESPAPLEAILVPVKRLENAKRRLAPALRPDERHRLALSLLHDALAAAAGWPLRLLVTADAEAAALASRAGWHVVEDPGGGLNAALGAGTRRAVTLGADALLVLPFDVPLATPEDLKILFATEAQVVVARSDDGGTTALLRRPPAGMVTAFGPDSAARHLAAARAAGLRAATVHSPGLALDIDNLDDLRQLANSPGAAASAQVARELLAAAEPA